MKRVSNNSFRYLIKTSRISVRTENLHIAKFCLHYLNFGCFDADLATLDILEFLRQGYYSFEDYAIAHWLDHVDSSTSQPLPLEANSFEPLSQKLRLFLTNHGLESSPSQPVSTEPRFQGIRHLSFTIELDGLAHLARQRKSNEKYLDLETHLQRRRLIYEDVVTNSNPQNEAFRKDLLLRVSGWFKCPKKHCNHFFDGFANKEDRDKHINQHERPFRCSFEECPYATLGYGTEIELKRHEKTSHPTSENSEWVFPTYKPEKDLDYRPEEDLNIYSASKKGDLTAVQRIVRAEVGVPRSKKHPIKKHPMYSSALALAVGHDHPDVVQYLLEQGCTSYERSFTYRSIRVFGIYILQMLLDNSSTSVARARSAQKMLHSAAKCGREEVIPLLLNYGIDIDHKNRRACTALTIARRHGHHSFAQTLLKHGAIDEKPNPEKPPKPTLSTPEQPPTPTPATPVTPQNASFFAHSPSYQPTKCVPSRDISEKSQPEGPEKGAHLGASII